MEHCRSEKKARILFTTSQYEFAHGKKPRGFGNWAFGFPAISTTEVFFVNPACTLTEAKSHAAAEAMRRGTELVAVLP